MKNTSRSLLSFAAACSGLLASVASAQVYYGNSTAIGSGWIRSYVELNSGAPARIGVQFNQDALTAFSTSAGSETLLSLPVQAPAPFNHVMVDWNPQGHPGPDYDVPHFDFHFYFSTPEAVDAIPFSLMPDPVNAAYVAPLYAPDAIVVPQMGQHYFDLLAPEFQPGGKFTETFIYGYNSGQMTFLEPMITFAYLEAGGEHVLPVRQPSNFQTAGYYPTEYGFTEQGGVFNVFLGNLTANAASPVPEPATWGASAALLLVGLVSFRRVRGTGVPAN